MDEGSELAHVNVALRIMIDDTKRKLAIAVEALEKSSKYLDEIKYDLEASVYTLEDEEFATVFLVRDMCDLALAQIKKKFDQYSMQLK